MERNQKVIRRYGPYPGGQHYDNLFCGKKCKAKRSKREAETLRAQEQAKAAQAQSVAETKRAEQETAKAQTEALRMQTATHQTETAKIEKSKAETGKTIQFVWLGVGLLVLIGGAIAVKKFVLNKPAVLPQP